MDSKQLELHEKFISVALEEAREGERLGEVPVGAVVVMDGEIIASSHNRKELDLCATRHAEIEVLEAASKKLGRWRLSDCDLYVTLEPCVMCAGAIVASRIRTLVYGATDPKGGAIESVYQITTDERLNHNCAVVKGVLQQECSEILRTFFKAKRESQKS
ncbi:MAG: nucleoside deaminase [Bdellovibrionales bacterium]|nr:nucleoside deaminase [Bdellovibrionales bacterium]